MAIQPDGKILIGYVSTPQSLLSGTEILYRYNTDGTPDTTFGTGGKASVPSDIDTTRWALQRSLSSPMEKSWSPPLAYNS